MEQTINKSTSVTGAEMTLTVKKIFTGQIMLTRHIENQKPTRILLTVSDVRALGECKLIEDCF